MSAVPPAPGAVAPDAVFRFRAADGTGLRGALWRGAEAPAGLAILLPGRTEYIEKSAITAAGLVARGYAVAALDWRGQGLSERVLEPSTKGHAEDFADYVADLAGLMAVPQLRAVGPVRLVLGHSMGGTVAVMARRAGVLPPVPAVLSAPLFGLAFGRVPRAFAAATISIARRTGRLDRWPPLPRAHTPYPLHAAFEDNLLTADRAVWDWTRAALAAEPGLCLALPTIGWFDAAERAMAACRAQGAYGAPVFGFVGSAERVVCPDAVHSGLARLGGRSVTIEGARHEPLIEAPVPRAAAWEAVDGFLASLASLTR